MFELIVLAALGYIVWKFKGKSVSKPINKPWETLPELFVSQPSREQKYDDQTLNAFPGSSHR